MSNKIKVTTSRTAQRAVAMSVSIALAEAAGHKIARSKFDPQSVTCALCARPMLPVCPYSIPDNVAPVERPA